MARRSEKTRYVDRWTGIALRLKGRFKNEIIEAATKSGVSVNEYVLYSAYVLIRAEKGIPEPGSAQYSIPTVQEEVAAYLRGETLLKPCGQKQCEQTLKSIDSLTFCETCNLRIS